MLSDGKVTVGFGTVRQTVGAMRLLPNPRVPERLLDPVRATASTARDCEHCSAAQRNTWPLTLAHAPDVAAGHKHPGWPHAGSHPSSGARVARRGLDRTDTSDARCSRTLGSVLFSTCDALPRFFSTSASRLRVTHAALRHPLLAGGHSLCGDPRAWRSEGSPARQAPRSLRFCSGSTRGSAQDHRFSTACWRTRSSI